MIKYVVGLLFNHRRDALVLIEKNRPDWQAGKLNGVGGKVEGDETPALAMSREFFEEAGIALFDWVPLVRLYRPNGFEVYFFSLESERARDVITKTDEKVVTVGIENHRIVPAWIGQCVPNLGWLVPMALDPCLRRDDFIGIPDVRGN